MVVCFFLTVGSFLRSYCIRACGQNIPWSNSKYFFFQVAIPINHDFLEQYCSKSHALRSAEYIGMYRGEKTSGQEYHPWLHQD